MKTMRKSVSLYAAFFRDPPLKKKRMPKGILYTKTRVKGGVKKNNLL